MESPYQLERPKTPTLTRLGRRASDLFLRHKKSMSNIRAARDLQAVGNKLRKKTALNCITESPESSIDHPQSINISPTPLERRLTISAYPYIGHINLEDGSSIANYSSVAEELDEGELGGSLVRRASAGALADWVLNSEPATSPPESENSSLRNLSFTPFRNPRPVDVMRVLSHAAEGNLYANIDLGLEDYPGRVFGRRPSGQMLPRKTIERYRHQFEEDSPKLSEVVGPLTQLHNDFLDFARERRSQPGRNPHQWPELTMDVGSGTAEQSSGFRLFSPYNPNVWNASSSEDSEDNTAPRSVRPERKISAYNPGVWDAASDEFESSNDTFFSPQQSAANEPTLQQQLEISQHKNSELEEQIQTLTTTRQESFDRLEEFQNQLTNLYDRSVTQEAELCAWREWGADWNTTYDPRLGILEESTDDVEAGSDIACDHTVDITGNEEVDEVTGSFDAA